MIHKPRNLRGHHAICSVPLVRTSRSNSFRRGISKDTRRCRFRMRSCSPWKGPMKTRKLSRQETPNSGGGVGGWCRMMLMMMLLMMMMMMLMLMLRMIMLRRMIKRMIILMLRKMTWRLMMLRSRGGRWWCWEWWCWGGGPTPRPGPILCVRLRNRNACGHFTRATMCESLQVKCRRPRPRPTLCVSLRSRNAHGRCTASHFVR